MEFDVTAAHGAAGPLDTGLSHPAAVGAVAGACEDRRDETIPMTITAKDRPAVATAVSALVSWITPASSTAVESLARRDAGWIWSTPTSSPKRMRSDRRDGGAATSVAYRSRGDLALHATTGAR